MVTADELFNRAQHVLPGGVSATARLNAVLGRPFYVYSGEGANVSDPDGKRYVDMCLSHCASLLGHRHPAIVEVVRAAVLGRSTASGASPVRGGACLHSPRAWGNGNVSSLVGAKHGAPCFARTFLVCWYPHGIAAVGLVVLKFRSFVSLFPYGISTSTYCGNSLMPT